MNIGYIHEDFWPLKDAPSVQSWQIYSFLKKKHNLFVPYFCHFPDANIAYSGMGSMLRFAKNIDALFIIVDGRFSFEKYSLISILKRKKIPLIWLVNSPVEEYLFENNNILSNQIEGYKRKFFARYVNSAICISELIQKYVVDELKIKNTYIVSNGADCKIFNPNRHLISRFKEFKSKFVVFWAGGGRYPWQGLDIISRLAVKCIEYKNNDVIFIIASDESWFTFSKLSNLVVCNSINYYDLPSFIKSSDLCLCLYHDIYHKKWGFYGSPMKIFDFMAMGKPVIASNYGQIGDIVSDGYNGYLTDNSIIDIYKKLIKIKNSSSLAKKLGENARKLMIDNYNWEIIGNKIESIIMDTYAKSK